ncbi:MAG: gluconate 2-dehydrogenase subunit 3 family protein [Bryobacterales bacterium]|nr:gluconate 2-dehydrogenase subunit 3 family protein [Bryobacterales bacterium]
MNRRELFRIGANSAAALAVAAERTHAMGDHPAGTPHPVNSESTAAAQAESWTPSVLDGHQNQTVVLLTELIIPETDTPGAKAALVNRYIDLFLRDGEPAARNEFLAGLNWLDGYAIRSASAPFAMLPEARQIAILEALDSGGPGLETGQQFFRSLKALTARIYYATEIGFKELNKGGRVPAGFGANGRNSE